MDVLIKIKVGMNKVIIGREHSGRDPTKNTLFDILSLADQLYYSLSATLDGLMPGKTYFSKNPTPDL